MTEGSPGILIANVMLDLFEPILARFGPVTCLWKLDDPMAFARSPQGQAVEIVVAAGSIGIDNVLFDALPNIRAMVVAGAGYDAIDFDRCSARSIPVSSTAQAGSEDVADTAVTMLLALNGRLQERDRHVRMGGWTPSIRGAMHRSVRDLNVGVVGMGAIGTFVANRLSAFGATIGWWGPRAKSTPYSRATSLADLARESDALILCAPATAANRHMINADILSELGRDGYLVNVGRGSLVDEVALRSALIEGRLAGAALDVFDVEPTPPDVWRDVPHVLLSPHSACFTPQTLKNSQDLVSANVEHFLGAGTLLTPVVRSGG